MCVLLCPMRCDHDTMSSATAEEGAYHLFLPHKSVSATKPAVDHETEYLHVLNDHRNRWPGLCCWWCTLEIKAQPLPMVTQIRRVSGEYQYQWRGFFCSPTCIKAYCAAHATSFSPTRAFLSDAGVLSWADGPVPPAASHLTQTRFGPKCAQSRQLRRSTQRIVATGTSTGSRASSYPRAGQQQQQQYARRPLSRKRARHCGANTLVPWLNKRQDPPPPPPSPLPPAKKICRPRQTPTTVT